MTTIYYVTLHFLVWDYSDTRPDEFINVNNQINFFTNPEIVLSNLGIVLGHVSFNDFRCTNITRTYKYELL